MQEKQAVMAEGSDKKNTQKHKPVVMVVSAD